mmetsp:Transcript_1787/g.3918  ORF Transcript_1787/g.3918 Transcript_1787/m.3918 type:complete len:111 (-) Transcript_1787:434-766(-)
MGVPPPAGGLSEREGTVPGGHEHRSGHWPEHVQPAKVSANGGLSKNIRQAESIHRGCLVVYGGSRDSVRMRRNRVRTAATESIGSILLWLCWWDHKQRNEAMQRRPLSFV